MNYFEYECKVLERLSELQTIESINIETEVYEDMGIIRNEQNILEHIIVARHIPYDAIRLNFKNNFHYEFNRKILKEAHGQGYSVNFIFSQIIDDIHSEYINTFLKEITK